MTDRAGSISYFGHDKVTLIENMFYFLILSAFADSLTFAFSLFVLDKRGYLIRALKINDT